MLGGFLTMAQDLYVEPKTVLAEEVAGLFNITLWIALFVFVLVEGLLLYMIFRFRKNTKVPKEESHRGHTTAEVVWTVIPAAILLFLGFLSAGTLIKLDEVPADTDFTVHVEASQFTWRFIYPDDAGLAYDGSADWCTGAERRARCSFNDMRLEEGSRVKIEVTAKDVIHAFAIPEFALKLDAVPGKLHYQWFVVPTLAQVPDGKILIQCMEYCGVGHHLMGPSQQADEQGTTPQLTIFAKDSQPLPYGRAPAATP